jgi:TRAP-type C4-dicarboxylate transport system permease small subunit
MTSILHRLSLIFAWLGGAVACAVAGMTVVSIAMRSLVGQPIQGDVEMTQFGIALTIALCLPWCQLHHANIIVDFFTQKLSDRANDLLDAVGAVLLGLMCALLAWRTSVGAIGSREVSETSMILSLPMWWAYASLAPGLALTALVAFDQAVGQVLGRPDAVAGS